MELESQSPTLFISLGNFVYGHRMGAETWVFGVKYWITYEGRCSNGKQVIYSAKSLIYYPVKLLVATTITANDIS